MAQSVRALLEVPLSEWSVVNLCWALNCLGRAGVSRVYPFVERGLDELLRQQQADGSWAATAGDTLQTLKALKRYRLFALSQSPPPGGKPSSPGRGS